jgi:hypothetical protein
MKRLIVMSAIMMILSACSGGGGSSVGNSGGGYTVGCAVSGLSGTVVLQNNDADFVTIGTNGAFTFPTSLADGTTYNVTVKTQPTGQFCSVVSGTGIISGANVNGVTVTCQAAIVWDAPISNTDGSPLSDVAGYNLYYGLNPGVYTGFIDVGNNTQYPIANFSAVVPKGTYYIVVTAYDVSKTMESTYSNEITTTVN